MVAPACRRRCTSRVNEFPESAMPEIGPLRDDELSLAFSLKQEYLDDSPFESWQIQRSTHPDLFLAARVDGHAIGICYGWPPDAEHVSADTIVLQGIAIAEDFSGKCHGSQLLHAFESQATGTATPIWTGPRRRRAGMADLPWSGPSVRNWRIRVWSTSTASSTRV
ncbi:MAG TPA: hypothetical protein DIC52_10985 [Candidatus Latescibacteria bacterium]|nr:hypothetical protein [Candidatus Latescibacterota bacterium]